MARSGDRPFQWITLQRDSAAPLQAQIVRWLESLIVSGRLGPGERLPVEATLVERLAVSRVTVRLAFDELVARGLVSRSHGRGSFVATCIVQHDLYSEQGFFDVVLAKAARPGTQLLDFTPGVPPAKIAALFGLKPGQPAMRIERLYLSAQRPVVYATGWLTPDAIALSRHDLEARSTASLHTEVLHHPVTSSTSSISAEIVGVRAARRLLMQPRAAVLVLMRSRFDAKGRLREYNRFIVDSTSYEFTLAVDGQAPFPAVLRSVAA